MGKIAPPELLTKDHLISSFDSGDLSLNTWLRKNGLKNQETGASRTFVVHINNTVVGYYCLATGSVMHHQSPGKIKRNMPNPIPIIVLGRLAVDITVQNQGIGKGLLKDALLRTKIVSYDAGVKALLVHALSLNACNFYKRFGFIESPIDEMTLMLSL